MGGPPLVTKVLPLQTWEEFFRLLVGRLCSPWSLEPLSRCMDFLSWQSLNFPSAQSSEIFSDFSSDDFVFRGVLLCILRCRDSPHYKRQKRSSQLLAPSPRQLSCGRLSISYKSPHTVILMRCLRDPCRPVRVRYLLPALGAIAISTCDLRCTYLLPRDSVCWHGYSLLYLVRASHCYNSWRANANNCSLCGLTASFNAFCWRRFTGGCSRRVRCRGCLRGVAVPV